MFFRWLSVCATLGFLWGVSFGCGPECPTGQTKCGEKEGKAVCKDLQTDRANCGECGKACDSGLVCDAGKCSVSCQKDLTVCDGVCVNTKTDLANCGTCGTKCKSGETCKEGKCELTCPDGQTGCSGKCVDTKTDTANCGSCGTACPAGEACSDGKCAPNCAKDYTACGSNCVNTQADRNHCGKCDAKCESGFVCNAGKCETSCQAGLTDCSGNCINPKTDLANCGACGTVCKSGEICKDGKCELSCADGTSKCGAICVDTKTSREHCGACDTKCEDGKVCKEGACALSCQKDYTDCSGLCVNLQTDKDNCGACGTKCPTGELCSAGKCVVYCEKGKTECSGSCVDTNFDAAHCSACGMACNAGEVCDQAKCVTACQGGDTSCGGKCTDLNTDPKNCGKCATACGAGEACIAGQCKGCTDCPQWAANVGAFGTDYTYDVATDASGNVYITGRFADVAKFGNVILTSKGGIDIYVVKFTPTGKVLWAVNAGGTGSDYGYGVAVDGSDNVYITGYYNGSATFGSVTLTSAGSSDIFVAKLDKNGNFLWAKSVGGTGSDYAYKIAVTSAGDAYIVGAISSTVTFAAATPITLTSAGGTDVFLAKYDKDGKEQWAGNAGSSSSDYGQDIVLDSTGNVYITGYFYSTITWGSESLTSAGSADIFVAKFDSTGKLLASASAGGSSTDYGYAISVDSTGNVYVGGSISSSGAAFGTSINLTTNGSTDGFIAKLNIPATGATSWGWAMNVGGSSSDYVYGVGVDSAGTVYASGYFSGDATFGTTGLSSKGSTDIFLLQIDTTGKIVGATTVGGTDSDYNYHLHVDSADNIYLVGYFYDLSTAGQLQLLTSGGADGYVIKYTKPSGPLCPSNGYAICNNACIDIRSDAKNCGKCNSLCLSGAICSAGKCVSMPTGLYLQEIHQGTDYVVLKNTSAQDIDLTGIQMYLHYNDSQTSSLLIRHNFAGNIIKAGATLYLVGSSTLNAGEIEIDTPIWLSSDNVIVMLCLGRCDFSQSTNVIDAFVSKGTTSTAAPTLPTGITFNGGPATGISSSNYTSESFVRVGTTGKNPTFEQTDWGVATKTRP